MISEAELRRLAGRWRADLMVVDLDYVLGCFLSALFDQHEASGLRFKGGTCLRKCYFPDYRFSEDLDFTAERRLSADALQDLLEKAARQVEDVWQIDFAVRPIRVEIVDDEYGKESYQARVYYCGPLRRGGDPRAIRVDVTTNEVLAFPVANRRILHPYSDADVLDDNEIPCYDLLEALAEKVRALSGQRQYAVSRDLYDVGQLTARHQMDLQRLAEAIPGKMQIKGLPPGPIDLNRLAARREQFEMDWGRNLLHLLPQGEATDFESVWQTMMAFLKDVNRKLPFVPKEG